MDKGTVPLPLIAYDTKPGYPTPGFWTARQPMHRLKGSTIGICVGLSAPLVWCQFTSWNNSFFGDLHIQGTESLQFYTQQTMTITRWFESPQQSHHDPVWKTGKG
jgi:malonate-semialdehyde dehydrogenase (acetylating)/methylmalonate-semialdehyde dehydrogenase